ncbi:hypothetical protein Bca4012_017050 [Brassica carinata]
MKPRSRLGVNLISLPKSSSPPPVSLEGDRSGDKVTDHMGLDYSYTQPTSSEGYGDNSGDSGGYNTTEHDILLDQAEIEAARRQYPPQPEVEFGFPKECYCGGQPHIATSYTRNDPGRRFYTCANIDDDECHIYKWWDVAATEEINAIGSQYVQLAHKVDYLASVSEYETELNHVRDLHYETELKVALLEKTVSDLSKKSSVSNGFELVVLGVVLLVVVVAMFVMVR